MGVRQNAGKDRRKEIDAVRRHIKQKDRGLQQADGRKSIKEEPKESRSLPIEEEQKEEAGMK